MEWPWWCVVGLAVMLIGITKSGFGSGVGLIIVPMTAIALGHIPSRGSEVALGLLLPLLIAGDLIAIWQYRHLFSLNVVKKLLPGTAVGVIGGGLLLWYFHQQPPATLTALIRIEIGFESILLVGIHWWRQARGMQQHLVPEPARSHLTGAFAGVSSTLAHAAGPIIAMYLLPLKLDRQLFVGTCAIYFFLLNTAKLPAYAAANQFQHTEALFIAQFLPLVFLGGILGRWMNRHMNDRFFSKLVYALTFLMGWYILLDGIHALL